MVDQDVKLIPGVVKANDAYLLVILGEKLELVSVNDLPLLNFYVGQERFRDLGFGDATGWYDWLVTEDDMPVGVRYIPRGESEELAVTLRRLRSVAASNYDDVAVEIFFDVSRSFDPSRSNDQAMGGNRLYGSEAGRYAVSFEMKWLLPKARDWIAHLAMLDR